MKTGSSRWIEITPSQYPWEREALDYVREQLPDHDPYRAFALFEFIASDGSINEVNLLAIAPTGIYLVEIKSWPGVVGGDQRDWVREQEGRRPRYEDNPLLLADRRAKRLASLLAQQPSVRKAKARIPFIQPDEKAPSEFFRRRNTPSSSNHGSLSPIDAPCSPIPLPGCIPSFRLPQHQFLFS